MGGAPSVLFWGGWFLILSGVELFLSANLKLALEVHFGPTGVPVLRDPRDAAALRRADLAVPRPAAVLRILGTLTALYSIIGLNLGGFFLGMILGVVGGGLAAAWSPGTAPATDETRRPRSRHL